MEGILYGGKKNLQHTHNKFRHTTACENSEFIYGNVVPFPEFSKPCCGPSKNRLYMSQPLFWTGGRQDDGCFFFGSPDLTILNFDTCTRNRHSVQISGIVCRLPRGRLGAVTIECSTTGHIRSESVTRNVLPYFGSTETVAPQPHTHWATGHVCCAPDATMRASDAKFARKQKAR